MIQKRLKSQVTAIISPIARGLLRVGITPNSVTVLGALGSAISAIYFFAEGRFFLGTLIVAFFILSDLFDGTMARLSNVGGTKWGALIDSTLDRVSDAAIYIGILFYAVASENQLMANLAVINLVIGGLIPYIRAKAESLGVECSVGIAERTERLVLILIGTGFYGLGLEPALTVAMSFIVIAGMITVVQRMLVVARAI